jgi:membrane-associated phospholipid phosphatase
MWLADLLRASPRIVLLAGFVAYLATKRMVCVRFLVYYLITEFFGVAAKQLTSAVLPMSMISRPKGAGNCKGCGVFPKNDKGCVVAENQIGMPSGHSMTLTMAATFWILWVLQKSDLSKTAQIALSVMLGSVAVAVMISRTKLMENCHTPAQVLVGGTIGVGLGFAFYYVDVLVFTSENYTNST